MAQPRGILVKGAREHNLKSIEVFVPRNQITVVTGLSGSGKSSLAFDTIFAEGQRRYVESLSSYARGFVEQMKKPDVDSISGLSPAIAIDQRSISHNPRSTVGTVSEVYDYLRLLMARVGTPECPMHKIPVESRTPESIVQQVLTWPKGTKFMLWAPVARGKKGEFQTEFQKWAKKGFTRARVDGQMLDLGTSPKLARHKAHDVDLLIDRLIVNDDLASRFKSSLQLALGLGDGQVGLEIVGRGLELYSIHSACPKCGFSFPELEPKLFSFNNPRGACETCHGLGTIDIEEYEVESLSSGELRRMTKSTEWRVTNRKAAVADEEGEVEIDERALRPCPDCGGTRLKTEVLHVKIGEKNIAEMGDLGIDELFLFLANLKLDSRAQLIGEKILQQIKGRLHYLQRVGAGYLSLNRPTRTLSGGEAQRIRLASQVGSSLVGVLYVLDEPSIGLHPRDHHRLLEILREIRDQGNTILMVEHDEETIRDADHLIDLGPRAGRLGGEIMAAGRPREVANNPNSVTGLYLSGRRSIEIPKHRRSGSGETLILEGATGNNLKDVTLKIQLGTLTGVSGVSGSGKSTLIIDTLYKHLARHFYKASAEPAPFRKITGLDKIDKVIEINQKPIGRTPRSVPATYVGLFPVIRDLYANLPDAKLRGFKPGNFSFNVKGGRCETCQGGGAIRVAMHFLADVFVPCDVCLGQRYTREILNLKFRDKSIADVLAMTVEEAADFFKNHPSVHRRLETLMRVGLDYMTLGQSSTTLSGGEAQRIKLSRELSKRSTGKTLYILDEPTTGLHFEDVRKLLDLLQELVDQGNTVLVIEHHLDVLKCCDQLIDLGPDGGKKGGQIVAEGIPESLLKVSQSETGKFLKALFHPDTRQSLFGAEPPSPIR